MPKNMTNIAQLLKDAPKGMKLYSPLFCEVEFVRIDKQSSYPIDVKDCKGNGKSFTEFGVYFAEHPDSECLLFPSKDCRTWEGWKLPSKPKFKVGDWIVYKDGRTFCGGLKTVQVQTVEEDRYIFTHATNGTHHFIDSECRLWSIADAKDGDVITNGKLIVIFNKLEEPAYKQHIIAYVGLDLCGRLQITEDTWQLCIDKAMPATKEQHDLLFTKMKEAGYTWDSEKKELKKIPKHYDIANFKAGMAVLVRDGNEDKWTYLLFSDIDNDIEDKFIAGAAAWKQCIPFEGNEHLLGTTEPCGEEFINW